MALKQEILKKSAFLTIWQGISKVIGVFYFSILVKALKPFQYGLLGICLSIFETFSTLFLCTNTSIVKNIAEKKQKSVFHKGLILNTIVGIILFIITFLFAPLIASFFDMPITNLVRLVALFLLVSSVKETFTSIFLGTTEIIYYIINEAFFTLLRLLIVAVILYSSYEVFGVLVGLILTAFITIIFSLYLIRKITFTKGQTTYHKIITYSATFFWLKLLHQFYPQIFIFLLAKYSTLANIGLYKFLYGIVFIVIVSIPQSFSLMLFPYLSRFSYNKQHDRLQKTYNMGIKFALYLALFLSAITLLVAKFIIVRVFPDYITAIPYILYFLIFGIIKSLEVINGSLIKATNNIILRLKITPIGIILSTILSIVLIPQYGVLGAIIPFIIGSFLNLAIVMAFLLKKLNITPNFLPTREDLALIRSLIRK